MKRESNIELCRMMAMLLVVLLHANYSALGPLQPSDLSISPLSSFLQAWAEQLCLVCVNVFVLISGWFGIRATLQGALSLLFQLLFYHLLIVIFFLIMGWPIPTNIFLEGFCLGASYWFVVSYLILYILSPILNAFAETSSPRIMASLLIAFFLMEVIHGWMIPDASFNYGYSAISFVGLYLLAQFLHRFLSGHFRSSLSTHLFLYLLFSLLPVCLFFATGHMCNMLAYSSPFIITASVFFFLFFNGLSFSSKVINYLACSSLSIYLIHSHPLVFEHLLSFLHQMRILLNSGWGYALFVLSLAIIFGLSCMLFDKLRIRLWIFVYNTFLQPLLTKSTGLLHKLYTRFGL